jgi:hypothetical protein
MLIGSLTITLFLLQQHNFAIVLKSPHVFSTVKKKPRYFYLGFGFIDRLIELNWRLKQIEGRINKVQGLWRKKGYYQMAL